MMYAVKIQFDTSTSIGTATKVFPYSNLRDAAARYNRMVYSHLLAKPVRVKGGRTIEILRAWLFEIETNDLDRIEALVESGNATLIDESNDDDLELES